jgi:hypothetical protein
MFPEAFDKKESPKASPKEDGAEVPAKEDGGSTDGKTELELVRENLNEEITSVMGELAKGKKADGEWANKFYSLNNKMIDHRNLEKKDAAIQRTKEVGLEAKKQAEKISKQVGGQAMNLFSWLKTKFSQKATDQTETGEGGEEIEETTDQGNGFLQRRIVHKLFFPLNLLYLLLYCWVESGKFDMSFYILLILFPLFCLGTVFYWLLARVVAQIKIATFLNTFLVLGLSSLGFTIILKIIGMIADAENFLKLWKAVGIWGMVGIILILVTALNTVSGKFVWLCSWMKSFVPAIIVTVIYILMIVIAMEMAT